MKNIDGMLHDARARRRVAESAPPAPLLPVRTGHNHRPWLVAAAAALTAAAAVVGAAVATGGGSRTPHIGLTSGSAPVSAAPGQLIVRDGDIVEADGVVVAAPGAPVEFCPTGWKVVAQPRRPVSQEPTCGAYGMVVTGVDLERLVSRQISRAGAVSGLAVLLGVLHGSTIRVTWQSAPPPVPRPSFPVTERAPCTPPASGWRGLVNLEAVQTYIDGQPDRFGGTRASDPLDSSWDPVKIAPTVELAIVGVTVGDVAQAQAELRARFGPNICAIRVATSTNQQHAAFEKVQRLHNDPSSGIYVFARLAFTAGVEITYLDPNRYAALEGIGLDRLSVTVWLKPVR